MATPGSVVFGEDLINALSVQAKDNIKVPETRREKCAREQRRLELWRTLNPNSFHKFMDNIIKDGEILKESLIVMGTNDNIFPVINFNNIELMSSLISNYIKDNNISLVDSEEKTFY